MAERIVDIPETVENIYSTDECDFLVLESFEIREAEGLTSFGIRETVLVRDEFHPEGLGVKDWLCKLADSVNLEFDSGDLDTVAQGLEWKSIVSDTTMRSLNG